jgi:uncharacterized membrane protein YcaP (DUF421 family)
MEEIIPFDWRRIWLSNETSWDYLGEVAFRTVVMFLFLLVILKFLSKRGVKQLSVFELAIIIALGSATGDPMFYHNVPLLQGVVVMVLVVLMYRTITRFTFKSTFLEEVLEGKPVCLLEDGRIDYDNFRLVKLPYDKFFAELRVRSVDHLGQVRRVYLETSGDVSIYLQKPEETRPGLPVYPELIDAPLKAIGGKGLFSCINCGFTQEISGSGLPECPVCRNRDWLPAWDHARVE